MIGHLQGQLLEIAPSRVLLDVAGVGYEVHVPLSTYYELQHLELGAAAALHVHTHVRDDAILLFGFHTGLERQLFEKLITISGIGPKLAQTVLSGMAPDDLIGALSAGDVRLLSSIPGIGKKTAERMVIELRDRVADLAVAPAAGKAPPPDNDLIEALISLGYRQAAAARAVAQATKENPEAEFADLLRASLKRLSRV